ncbi:MAG TPA: YciI family protein [Vicinamibacterales bacterium]|nr:YciI family protein [Vicinamibacterales bacterium]
MSEYLFLYRGGNHPTSPQEGQAVMQQWMTWLQDLAKQGHVKDKGQPLEPGGKVVAGRARTVTDGPFAEAKDLVGGYTLVNAKSLDEAAELTKGCPIFDGGGLVEVRPVMKM